MRRLDYQTHEGGLGVGAAVGLTCRPATRQKDAMLRSVSARGSFRQANEIILGHTTIKMRNLLVSLSKKKMICLGIFV
jgi:hypothetical protein